MRNLFYKLFRSLNVRLSIVILSISFTAYSILRIASERTYVNGLYSKQEIVRNLWEKFVNHPDYNKAVKLMPADLADLTAFSINLSANTLTYYNTLIESRLLIIFSVFLFVGPILVLSTIIINRYIAAPMKKLTDATQRLAQGDFSSRTDLNKQYWDRYSVVLAEDFNTMADSLESLETERRTMISDIAHELRTPITAMQLQLEAVEDDIEPLNMELIDALYGETELLSSLIIDLRTLSLAESRQLSLELQTFDLHSFMNKIVARFNASAQKKDIKLSIEGNEDLELYADAERLNQVLNNLVSNAIRHTPESGKVTLSFEAESNGINISVVNTGSALPEEELAQIFNRFYRSGQGRVRAEGGSGLGLAIVKALTELHSGTISAQNYGEDSIKFSLALPQNYS